MSEALIETNGLTKKYSKKRQIKKISLNVQRGTIYGLYGENGSGKSTLVKMLLGLIRPTSGYVYIGGKEVTPQNAERRQRVSYVSEDLTIYPNMRISKLFQWMQTTYRHWDESRCYALLQGFKLPLNKKMKQLSYEMRLYVALTIALSIRPHLIILDEPTKKLNEDLKTQVLTLLAQECANHRTTIFFTTSDRSDVERFAHHIGIIRNGEMVFQGCINDRTYESYLEERSEGLA